MQAERYRAPMPYPLVTGLKPNRKQAVMLVEGYCGKQSEFTTVAQYAYHHLRCLKNAELSAALKGIYIVETDHLEFLGRCLVQLGANPQYLVYQGQDLVPWRSNCVNYEDCAREMLLADIAGEKGAAEYYAKTARTIGDPKIARLLLRLEKDEWLHYRIFSDLYERYFARR